MSIFMTLRIAFKALGRNKLRTALTMLGMIIGVGAVIAMVALGTGAQAMIEDQVKTAGTNLLTIYAGSTSAVGGVRGGSGTGVNLLPEDAQALRDIPEGSWVHERLLQMPSAREAQIGLDAPDILRRVVEDALGSDLRIASDVEAREFECGELGD